IESPASLLHPSINVGPAFIEVSYRFHFGCLLPGSHVSTSPLNIQAVKCVIKTTGGVCYERWIFSEYARRQRLVRIQTLKNKTGRTNQTFCEVAEHYTQTNVVSMLNFRNCYCSIKIVRLTAQFMNCCGAAIRRGTNVIERIRRSNFLRNPGD